MKEAGIIIPAAGSGTRMGAGRNKMYLDLEGIPILARTIGEIRKTLPDAPVLVMVGPGEEELFRKEILTPYGFEKIHILEGGATRQQTVRRGLSYLRAQGILAEDAPVLIHDGARPLVTGEILRQALSDIETYGAQCVCVPVKDTIKRAGPEDTTGETLVREELLAAQTPQGGRLGELIASFDRAEADGFLATDDASVLENAGIAVHVTPGSYENIKLTEPSDFSQARAILASRQRRNP